MSKSLFFSIVVVVITLVSCKKDNFSKGIIELPRLPVANAGSDTIIALPSTIIKLSGNASYDPDGTINNYQWRKISGPAQGSINNSQDVEVTANNLVKGKYFFELKVTDNSNLSATDTIIVTVTQIVANSGPDQDISVPTDSTTLDGTGSFDDAGMPLNFLWRQISGSNVSLNSPSEKKTTIYFGQAGIYQFELLVWNNYGSAYDTTTVMISKLNEGRHIFIPQEWSDLCSIKIENIYAYLPPNKAFRVYSLSVPNTWILIDNTHAEHKLYYEILNGELIIRTDHFDFYDCTFDNPAPILVDWD
jgi:hypothetical protein